MGTCSAHYSSAMSHGGSLPCPLSIPHKFEAFPRVVLYADVDQLMEHNYQMFIAFTFFSNPWCQI